MKKSFFITTIIMILVAVSILLAGVSGEQVQDDAVEKTSQEAASFENVTLSSDRVSFSDKDGILRSVKQDQIQSGGPSKDGIPSIDSPVFESVKSARKYLKDDDVGIIFKQDGETKFYPYSILVYHEIVNDTIGGNPILVTYCPLCETGIIFDPVIEGERVLFGTSGMLWESNLLMYDRVKESGKSGFDFKKESLWSQVLGEAVVGPGTGKSLEVLGSQTVAFAQVSREYPDMKVLSRDTGFVRDYGTNPYQGYAQGGDIYFEVSRSDQRLHPKTFVYGIQTKNGFRAYQDSPELASVSEEIDGEKIELVKAPTGVVTITKDGKEISFVSGFWFSWFSVHPDTTLFQR